MAQQSVREVFVFVSDLPDLAALRRRRSGIVQDSGSPPSFRYASRSSSPLLPLPLHFPLDQTW